jgi:Glycosyltransferase family 10 (fucosyltransferase) C-term
MYRVRRPLPPIRLQPMLLGICMVLLALLVSWRSSIDTSAELRNGGYMRIKHEHQVSNTGSKEEDSREDGDRSEKKTKPRRDPVYTYKNNEEVEAEEEEEEGEEEGEEEEVEVASSPSQVPPPPSPIPSSSPAPRAPEPASSHERLFLEFPYLSSLLPDVPPQATHQSPSLHTLVLDPDIARPSRRRWSVASGTGFFGGPHPWATGSIDCPGGCEIDWKGHFDGNADIALYHDNSGSVAHEPRHENQLVALWAAETFDLHERPAEHFNTWHTELTYRSVGFFRDGYMSYFLDALDPGKTYDWDALRTWEDIYGPVPVKTSEKKALKDTSIAWASGYCGAKSQRENIVSGLLSAGIPVAVYNAPCLKNVPESEAGKSREEQHEGWKRHKYFLSLDNHICMDYVTEKTYLPLFRGSVPIIYGAPNTIEFMPAYSYIDATWFPNTTELARFLLFLESNPNEYELFHAWRSASVKSYGKRLAKALVRWLAVAMQTPIDQDKQVRASAGFRCDMCYSLQEWAEKRDWLPPFSNTQSKIPRRIPPFRSTCTSGWDPQSGPGNVPGFSSPRVEADEFYSGYT